MPRDVRIALKPYVDRVKYPSLSANDGFEDAMREQSLANGAYWKLRIQTRKKAAQIQTRQGFRRMRQHHEHVS